MHVTVTFRNADASEPLKQYAAQKLQKLKKLLIKPEEVHVTYSVEKFRHHVELIVSANGDRFVCNEESKDMYEAVDLALDRIEKQLRRYKERARHHKGEATLADQPLVRPADAEVERTPV